MMFKYALYDEEGNVVRYFDYHAEGALPYPPDHPCLALNDPEWDNPLFQERVMCSVGDWVGLFLAGSISLVIFIIGLCVAWVVYKSAKEW